MAKRMWKQIMSSITPNARRPGMPGISGAFRLWRMDQAKGVIQVNRIADPGPWRLAFRVTRAVAARWLVISDFVCSPHPQTRTSRARKWSGRIQSQRE